MNCLIYLTLHITRVTNQQFLKYIFFLTLMCLFYCINNVKKTEIKKIKKIKRKLKKIKRNLKKNLK